MALVSLGLSLSARTAVAQALGEYHSEEVTFPAGDLTLGGLFFRPEGPEPFPAAVIIRGSGPSRRDSYWGRAVAEVLLDAGVAVLLPDKRGSDASGGDWRTADFGDLAGDALAGVRFAGARPEVRAESVGVVGLSQGGRVAPVAAARSDEVAWVVNLVGAATPFREQVSWEMYHTFREAGLEGRDLERALSLQLAAEGYVTGEVDWATYHAALERAREGPLAEVARGFPASRDAPEWEFFRGVVGFDPLPYWRRTRQPVLAVYGEDDPNAPSVRSAYRLLRAFRAAGHPDAAVRVLADTGHGLWDPESPDPHHPALHPELVSLLRGWVRERSGRDAFTDPRDGVSYGTVIIGGQEWMAENLRYDAGPGSRCYADDPSACEESGRLYTWPAALESCPPGWRLPTEDDWRRLESAVGLEESDLAGTRYRGTDEGARLRRGGGSGFDGRLSGYMRPDGTPRRKGERAAFWTATEERPGETAWHRDLSRDPRVYRSPVDLGYYLSVRCVAGEERGASR